MAEGVALDVRDRIVYLTLDRPQAMNGIDEDVLAALPRALEAVAGDERAKALVITGAGEAFCVGLDIDLLHRAFADLGYFRDVLERFKRILLDVEALPVPVVAAVNGLARAGGFELILTCDLVLMAEEARVADHHLSFGIIPGGGATQRASRRIGHQRARELIWTGRWMDGREASDVGLALRAVPGAELDKAVEELVAPFRELSRPCLGATKDVMNRGADLPLEEALDLEIESFIRFLDTEPTAREGYRAYVERRRPSWP